MKGVDQMPTIQDSKSSNLDSHSLWVETTKGFGMKACICATRWQETSRCHMTTRNLPMSHNDEKPPDVTQWQETSQCHTTTRNLPMSHDDKKPLRCHTTTRNLSDAIRRQETSPITTTKLLGLSQLRLCHSILQFFHNTAYHKQP